MGFSKRRKARAAALSILYAHDLIATPIDAALKETLQKQKFSQMDIGYLDKLLTTVKENLPIIDKTIKKHLANWTLDRLSYIDRVILRIATAEMLFLEEVPPKVSIDEAIELAKKYSGKESQKFINGVLDAIYKNQRK